VLKISTFRAESDFGLAAVPLFGPADAVFEKTASRGLMPEVVRYIETLRPRRDAQYTLVNAMGASEYFSSNINGDHFPEVALIHKPDNWTGNPLLDKKVGREWPYGFPTFYGAHPFAHHKNKDASRAYGEVELTTWNEHMKRVELVTRVDRDKCERFGGVGVWDKLQAGQFPDVSMGSKVPWDLCSICADWDAYRKALATYDPKQHRHPGVAVLEFHKKLKEKNGVGIRGLSITRSDYCEHAGKAMNKILPDGRKVCVYNFFPRFFDISFVFIGADRTAKVMVFIKRVGFYELPSVMVAENLGLHDKDIPEPGEKKASIDDHLLEQLFKKDAAEKQSMDKKVEPNLPPGKAVTLLTEREPDLSNEMMRALSVVPMRKSLSTLTGLGIVLRPSEFQRVVKDRKPSDEELKTPMCGEDFMPALARLLMPAMAMRSALGPYIEQRVLILAGRPPREKDEPSSLSSDSLRKMGAAYTAYRCGVMDVVARTQSFIESAAQPSDAELFKLATAPVEELFTPLAFHYLNGAFRDEASFGDPSPAVVETSSQAFAGVQRGLPSRTTW
jgi:hypothetical protein